MNCRIDFKSFVFLLIFSSVVFNLTAQVKEKEILLKNGDTFLPGTLQFTNSSQPLIIWVHGSGNVDRNGNQKPMIKANYIAHFRTEVVKNNIAFFSFDKRTSNPENLEVLKKGVVFDDFVSDVKAVVSYFKKKYNFSEIVLLGHSQGSLVSILASKGVDKLISVAGPSKRIDEIMVEQVSKQNAIGGLMMKYHFKELKETGAIKEVNPMLASVFSKANLPFIKTWMAYVPSKEIKKIEKPILFVHGGKDLQVSLAEAKILSKACLNCKLVVDANMNHVLKEVATEQENKTSYFKEFFPISKVLIKEVCNFVNSNKK